MREFIGHEVKFVVADVGVVTGTVVDDTKLFLLVKGSDGSVTRVVKGKICAFTPVDFEPHKYVPFYVLQCFNKTTGCPGVSYIKEGGPAKGFKQSDFDFFMEDCPARCDTCGCGSKGELRTADSEFLSEMLTDTVFGDYPKLKREKKSAGTDRTAGSGEGTSAGSDGGEEPSGGADGEFDEPEDGTDGEV